MLKHPTPPEGTPEHGYSGPSDLRTVVSQEPSEHTVVRPTEPSVALGRALGFKDFSSLVTTALRLSERLRAGDPTAPADAHAFANAINNPVSPEEMTQIATERNGLLRLITTIYTPLEPQRTITPGPSTILSIGRRGIRVRYVNRQPKPEQTDQA